MGFLGSMFGSSRGMGYEVERAASPEQAQQLYNQQQQQLQQQQAFAQALMAQSPQAIANQQMVAGQLAAQSQGMGPSVAREQLKQATAQNIAQTGALMGSQRGAGANVGLMARQAGMAGAQAQQQAAAQAATLRAQEQLGAQAALGQLSGQQLGQVQGAQQLGIQGVTGAQQNILNAIAQRNAAQAGIEQQIAQSQGGLFGGLLGGIGMMMAEGGEVKKEEKEDDIGSEGYWSKFKKGYEDSMLSTTPGAAEFKGAQKLGEGIGKGVKSLFAQKTSGTPGGGYAGANLGVPTQMPAPINPLATSQTIGAFKLPLNSGGQVPAMVSPGEKYLSPGEVKKVAEGKKEAHKAGVTIPGKAKVQGDSLKNDTVPATLKEGGIVIPRSVMQSDDPAESARKFVAAIMAKKQVKRS